MNIYLAARYDRYPELQGYAKELETLGHTVTSRWILGDHDIRAQGQSEADAYMPLWAQEDYEDLARAAMCISFTEGPQDVPGRSRGGRHCEHGMAVALGLRCIVIGYRENVFHWLLQVEYFPTWQAFLATVQKASHV